MNTQRIASPYLLSENGRLEKNAVVEFDCQGTVISVQYNVENIDKLAATRYYNGILIPGMVNSHCHLELSFYQGVIPKHTGLVDFIKKVVSQRSRFSVEEKISKAKLQSQLMWKEGVQAVGDISNDDTSFAAKCQSAIHYHTFAEYFGTPKPEETQSFYHSKTKHVDIAQGLGLIVTPTPHSTYLVSDDLFKMGASSKRLSIHFMEIPSELELFQCKGGMYDFMIDSGMYPDFLHYGSHPHRLVESLPSDVPLLLIHNTQCKLEDIQHVMSHFNDVTFVLCPRSNYYIETAYPPIDIFLKSGARVALGTDSLSSNESLSMAEEIKWLSINNPSLELSTILQWATIGGAQALGIEDKIGSFTVGKQCGAVLLSDIDFKIMKPTAKTKAERIKT